MPERQLNTETGEPPEIPEEDVREVMDSLPGEPPEGMSRFEWATLVIEESEAASVPRERNLFDWVEALHEDRRRRSAIFHKEMKAAQRQPDEVNQ